MLKYYSYYIKKKLNKKGKYCFYYCVPFITHLPNKSKIFSKKYLSYLLLSLFKMVHNPYVNKIIVKMSFILVFIVKIIYLVA